MKTFIAEVVSYLISKSVNFSETIFILPNKRAGLFLKRELSSQLQKTFFAPEILSSEEFFSEMSQLNPINNIESLFIFYEVYLEITPEDQIESFDKFSSWAQLLIKDFIEIDRYLIEPSRIFEYLSAIKDINHWYLDNNQSESIKNYLSFWKRLHKYYLTFNDKLLQQQRGHQGLQYREAINNLESYIATNAHKKHILVGFNALNKAEEVIFQELLTENCADIFWDIDKIFFDHPLHDAGFFIRQYHKNWSFYKANTLNWILENYGTKKEINIIGAIKNVGQVKQIGAILREEFSIQDGDLSKTAVILGDEHHLIPLLNTLPSEIKHINITMGLPLKQVSLSSLFELLFNLHQSNPNKYYYKDVINLLNHTNLLPLYTKQARLEKDDYIKLISNNNISFITFSHLSGHLVHNQELVNTLFKPWNNNPIIALTNCLNLIVQIKTNLNEEKNKPLIELSNSYKFYILFNELNNLINKNTFVNTIEILFGLYKELLKNETIDFRGEPLKGLQIMGVLESRLLDFETVIISGVNEGILPAGKQHNSFIPFDVKIENGLPTFKEKDAIYAYHFYRLIQRAKKVFILYNTEPDVLVGGEPSRFIKQLEIENIHQINQLVSLPKTSIALPEPKVVIKTTSLINDLQLFAKRGFSPSSLTNYIRNPIDFYYSKVLNIKELEEVEETVAANTLGNVLHKVLEDFYQPYVGDHLQIAHLSEMLGKIDGTVAKHFETYYHLGDVNTGKNLIIFEVAKRYIFNFIHKEIETLQTGSTLKIVALEKKISIEVQLSELNFPIKISGVVDRIDEIDGMLRIIDYKSGKVLQNEVEIAQWEDLTSDYKKYSKSFQLLTYAYMLYQNNDIKLPITAGIISFKNLQKNYVLEFSKTDKIDTKTVKNPQITIDTLNHYFEALKNLVLEIFNLDIPFIEKEI